MNKPIGDANTLKEVAVAWGKFPIKDPGEAVKFMSLLRDRTRGFVILDFIDASNWDCFESYSYNEENRLFQINWHDFIGQDKGTASQGREMMSMLFPASLYSVAMRLQSIDLVEAGKLTFFAFRAYALTDKEIKSALKQNSEEYALMDDRAFSKRFVRKINGHWEVIDCINSAYYSLLVVPKKMRFRPEASKLLLYYKNFDLIDATLRRCEKELAEMDPEDTATVSEKANTIRRSMEILLKIECCYREIELKKAYSAARIGDLWGALKKYHSEPVLKFMATFIEWANELSHDTGAPIWKVKADFILIVALDYLGFLKKEVYWDFKYPRRHRSDEEPKAF
jgi:hypothetical protein